MRKSAFLLLILTLAFLKTPAALGRDDSQKLYKADILQVEDGKEENHRFRQIIIAQFTEGPYTGKTVRLTHDFNGYPTDLKYSAGNSVFILECHPSDAERFAIAGPVRANGLYTLMVIFLVSVVIIAGFQGIRSIISLSLIFMVIFYILVPLVIRGFNPIGITLILAALSTVFTIFFVSGINHKTIAAVIGTISGLVTAGCLAWHFGNMVLLTGYSDESVQMLQYTASTVNFKGLLFSGIIMGALGAIMDISVSIASSISEIKQSNPSIDFSSLVAGGFRVGKDAISTMTNTLVLAYAGTSFPLLMLYQIHRTPYRQIINHDEIASEIVRMLSGSIGLLAAVPVTVFIAALIHYEAS
jgi:uncharacterized membrane protein